MLFKNARLFKLELDENVKALLGSSSLEELENRLHAERFKPASAQEMQGCGFVPVLGRHTEAYSFSFNNNHFFRFREQNKLLPKAIIEETLLDYVDEKEAELQRPLKKAERQTLREAVTNKLMGQAFSTTRELLIMINSQYGFALVSATSAKRAEAAVVMLSKALGALHARAFQPRCSVNERLTGYLTGAALPQGFTLGNDTVLKADDEKGATVRISKDELVSPEITSHIQAGKVVTEMQFTLEDTISFVLTSEIVLKRLSLSDQYLEKTLPEQSEDAIADLQSMFIVEGDVLTHLTGALITAFNCE